MWLTTLWCLTDKSLVQIVCFQEATTDLSSTASQAHGSDLNFQSCSPQSVAHFMWITIVLYSSLLQSFGQILRANRLPGSNSSKRSLVLTNFSLFPNRVRFLIYIFNFFSISISRVISTIRYFLYGDCKECDFCFRSCWSLFAFGSSLPSLPSLPSGMVLKFWIKFRINSNRIRFAIHCSHLMCQFKTLCSLCSLCVAFQKKATPVTTINHYNDDRRMNSVTTSEVT